MKATIQPKNLNKIIKKVVKRISSDYKLSVGIFGKQDSKMVVIASANEFGTDKAGKNHNISIPERSFMRSAFREEKENIVRIVKNNIIKIVKGQMTEEQLYNVLGEYFKTKIQEKISSNIQPPNKPSTIKRKGSSATLIDNGRLRQSITYETLKDD